MSDFTTTDDRLPKDREPTLRVVPMPADANFTGDIFGGWVMSHVDIAGSIPATRRARGLSLCYYQRLDMRNPPDRCPKKTPPLFCIRQGRPGSRRAQSSPTSASCIRRWHSRDPLD